MVLRLTAPLVSFPTHTAVTCICSHTHTPPPNPITPQGPRTWPWTLSGINQCANWFIAIMGQEGEVSFWKAQQGEWEGGVG